jgi:hypothetical protein
VVRLNNSAERQTGCAGFEVDNLSENTTQLSVLGFDMSIRHACAALAFFVISLSSCSKVQATSPSTPSTSASVILPQIVPPQAVSLADAKRVFAAHDCCGRYINTDIQRVGALHARGRIFTVFHLVFANPENNHGMEHVAILDGMRLLGTYQMYGTHIWFDGSKILFGCSADERDLNAELCDRAAWQPIDMTEPRLPKTRLIYGQLSYLGNSI